MTGYIDESLLRPKGFSANVENVGVRDDTDDFVCVFSTSDCTAAAVFTQSRFAGPSVNISRKNVANGDVRAIVAISKNANVANGKEGEADAMAIVEGVAKQLGIEPSQVIIASTGVIGRRYPLARIMGHVDDLAAKMDSSPDFGRVARGIMTTDLVPKAASRRVGEATIVGVAKGVGMMEPNMATLLTFFFTDAEIDRAVLDALFRRVMDKSFNCLSIDTDTSTSDTAAILANGEAGPVDVGEFESALAEIANHLVKAVAKDGEGATKLIEVTVDTARDEAQAKRVAKAVVNSPLVKTAVHGADPNWGRVAMAIGKCHEDTDIVPEKVVIRFGGEEVYPKRLDETGLVELTELLKSDEVKIGVSLGIGDGACTVWGCDLSAEYVRINGEYST